MSNKKENIDVPTVKKWLKVIIAVLSALMGALAENATNFIGGLL